MPSMGSYLPKPVRNAISRLLRRRRDLAELRAGLNTDPLRSTFMGQFFANEDLVFDVGANVGHRLRFFQSVGAKVIAFEPQPYCVGILKRVFGDDPLVSIVPKGVGREPVGYLREGSAHTISSMSEQFIDAVSKTGRFGSNQWRPSRQVALISLDEALSTYGTPVFIKIDVEGYEEEVIKSLSTAVPALCFEYVPELRRVAESAVRHLADLGPYKFQLAVEDRFAFELPEWLPADAFLLQLQKSELWGDVYARVF